MNFPNFSKGFLVWFLIFLFAVLFNVFVLMYSADQTLLNPTYFSTLLAQTTTVQDLYNSQPAFASAGFSFDQFNSFFTQTFVNLIQFLRGDLPELTIQLGNQNLASQLPLDLQALYQARSAISLFLKTYWFLLPVLLILLLILIGLQSSIKDRVQIIRKTFWRTSLSLTVTFALAYVFLPATLSQTLPSIAPAGLSTFLSAYVTGFLISGLTLCVPILLLSILLWLAEKFVLKN